MASDEKQHPGTLSMTVGQQREGSWVLMDLLFRVWSACQTLKGDVDWSRVLPLTAAPKYSACVCHLMCAILVCMFASCACDWTHFTCMCVSSGLSAVCVFPYLSQSFMPVRSPSPLIKTCPPRGTACLCALEITVWFWCRAKWDSVRFLQPTLRYLPSEKRNGIISVMLVFRRQIFSCQRSRRLESWESCFLGVNKASASWTGTFQSLIRLLLPRLKWRSSNVRAALLITTNMETILSVKLNVFWFCLGQSDGGCIKAAMFSTQFVPLSLSFSR